MIIFTHCWALQLSTFPNISIKKRHYTSCAQLAWESSLKGTDKLSWGTFWEKIDVKNNNKKYICVISVNKKQSWKTFEQTSRSTLTFSSPIPMLKLFLESRKVQIILWGLALTINDMAKDIFKSLPVVYYFFSAHTYYFLWFKVCMTRINISTETYR